MKTSQLSSRLSVVVAAAAVSLLLGACDEAPPVDDPGSIHRIGKKVVYEQKGGTPFTLKITPSDDDDGGDPFPELSPVVQWAFDGALRNADAIATASHADSFLANMKCPALCERSGAGWTGDVAVDGAYEMGEPELVETEEGLLWQADVHAEFDLQCVCEG